MGIRFKRELNGLLVIDVTAGILSIYKSNLNLNQQHESDPILEESGNSMICALFKARRW